MVAKKLKDNLEATLATVVSDLKDNAEFRAGQLEMLQQVNSTITNGNCSIIKAGTGIGKSFAYLIPSLLSGKKIVIATATKTLQDQLAKNDLPVLLKALKLDLSYTVLKGRSNYLCKKSFEEHIAEKSIFATKLLSYERDDYSAVYDKLLDWLAVTEVGDLSELDIEITPDLAKRISVTSDECIGARFCPKGDVCFAEKANKRAEQAAIVIVNLHLLCLDIAYENILKDYEVLIIDEVHELEDIMTKTLGFMVSSRRFSNTIAELRAGFNELLTPRDNLSKIPFSKIGYTEAYINSVFVTLSEELPQLVVGVDAYLEILLGRRILYGDVTEDELGFISHLRTMEEKFQFVLDFLLKCLNYLSSSNITDYEESNSELSAVEFTQYDTAWPHKSQLPDKTIRAVRVATKLLRDVQRILLRDGNLVIYVEHENGFLKLEGMPLELSAVLPADTFTGKPTVMTSATIDEAITSRLGIAKDKVTFIEVQSPFDYSSNSLLYIPSHLPDPRQKAMNELKYEEIVKLLTVFHGKALVLFTSKSAMEEAYAFCLERVSTDLIMQGRYSRRFLIDKFSDERDTSLFATMSFWQGVDVPGESLSLVIIDKIPFPRPDDPLLMARRELAGDAGFRVVDLPRAASLLAQGVGRLIRRSTDRGLVVILDPRLNTARYRTYLIDSLPAMPITTDYQHVLSYLSTLSLNDN